ncbi:MAG: DNRLRE domain-containing protein [Bacteroidia bacterium]
MKTVLKSLLTILLTGFFLKANSQWLFTASPSANDYCNSWQAVTLTINNPVAGHTYEWSREDDYQFSLFGYSPSYVFDSVTSVQVYAGYYGVCVRIMLTEYDASHNAVGYDYFTLGSNTGNIPYYYTNYNCGSIMVPFAYTSYAIQSAGRWAMWYKDGVATGISDPFIQEPDNGVYVYKLKLACGDTIATDNISAGSYPPKPAITATGNTTVCNGDTVLLSTPAGYNAYQWRLNGVNIPGATSTSYRPTVSGNYTVGGNYYSTSCYKESAPFAVTVQSGAFITSPVSVACVGDSIQLTCASASSYMWKKNGNTISGANTQSIYIKTTGTYRVITTGLTCNTSKTKDITFYANPTISTVPTGSVNICNGTGVTLTASGNNISKYQWFKNGDALVGGTTPSIYIAKAGNYKCVVSNQIGCSKTSLLISATNSVSSTLPTKTLVLQPSSNGIDTYIESYIGGQTTNYGNASFMEISNWYKGLHTADRTLLKFDLSSIPQGGTVISASLRLYVDSVVAFTNTAQHLILKNITQNWNENTVTFSTAPAFSEYESITVPHNVVANKTPFNVSIKDFVNFWVNDSAQNKGMMIMLDEFVYPVCWLRISSGDNPIMSQHPKLTVSYAYAKIDTSAATTFCNGDSVIFSTNTGSYTYQWYQNNNAIVGANASTFAAKTTGDYFVVITNGTGCTVSSATKHLTVNTKPAATITASGPTTFCNGDSVKLQANTGANLSYQWLKNNANISNATANIYTAKTSGAYKVKVTNAYGCSKQSVGVNVSVPCRLLSEVWDENALDARISPNPSTNDFEIGISDETIISKLMVFDVEGRLLETYTDIFSGFRIGENWQRGVYNIQIVTGDLKMFKRVVKL